MRKIISQKAINKPPETTIYISNLSEDVWPFIQNISRAKHRSFEIEENAFLADRDLFSMANESRAVWISPKPVTKDFLDYFYSVIGKKDIEILVPQKHGGEICLDVLQDSKIFNRLVSICRNSIKTKVIPYSTSLQFLKLISQIRKMSNNLTTPESPNEEDAWTVNFFGSKSGIRQLAQQSTAKEPDLIMPAGYICVGIEDASKIAAKKYLKENGVVLKTNKGHSGAGVLIFRPNDLPNDYQKAEKIILTTLKRDSYWNKFPIIIEGYINISSKVAGGFPNVEFKINKNGQIELLYFCGMRVTKEGIFRGVEIHNNVVSDKIEAQITDTGFYVGEKYSQAGYRGYYDVDFAVSKNGTVYVTESNVRRTGGTHVYHLALKIFGKDFMHETFTLSNNGYILKRQYSFAEMLKTLKPILFRKNKKEGIIIISENILRQNKLAYVIFSKTRKKALEIENEMERLLLNE